jgi:hypothetical protein
MQPFSGPLRTEGPCIQAWFLRPPISACAHACLPARSKFAAKVGGGKEKESTPAKLSKRGAVEFQQALELDVPGQERRNQQATGEQQGCRCGGSIALCCSAKVALMAMHCCAGACGKLCGSSPHVFAGHALLYLLAKREALWVLGSGPGQAVYHRMLPQVGGWVP